jgi:hypothetical protein
MTGETENLISNANVLTRQELIQVPSVYDCILQYLETFAVTKGTR